jgi:hypothetical protein
VTNPRELSGQAFLDWQLEHRYDAHVAPLNLWIDERNEASAPEWLPFISPIHGGVNARIITLLRDPGPFAMKISPHLLNFALSPTPVSAPRHTHPGTRTPGIAKSKKTS